MAHKQCFEIKLHELVHRLKLILDEIEANYLDQKEKQAKKDV